MLRPFHSLEHQCAAERRLKAERSRFSSSKAGFMGQLHHLNLVAQQLQSMCPSAEQRGNSPLKRLASPEARLDLTGDRWSMLPGSAPPPLLCRPALASNASPFGPGRSERCTTSGFANRAALSKGSRRRRPVHVTNLLAEDDPALIDFNEEPEDPRVYLPAHRIGDLLPEAATEKKEPVSQRQVARSCKPSISKSMPALHIAARRLPLRPLRGGTLAHAASLRNAGYGGAGGAVAAKPMSRQHEEVARSLPQDFDDNIFPEAPEGLSRRVSECDNEGFADAESGAEGQPEQLEDLPD